MFSKAGLLVVGMLVAGSTVYALVLRTTGDGPEPLGDTSTATQQVKRTASALVPAPTPRTWGRLVMLQQPNVEKAPTITTPPLLIAANEPTPSATTPRARPRVRSARVAAKPTGQLPPTATGVMARFKAVPEPVENLPETPNRNAIAQVMDSVRSRVQDCYDTGMVPGQVDLTLTVEGESGNVKNARVSAGSSTATCIRRVARSLKFPRFSRNHVTIRYPYSFR